MIMTIGRLLVQSSSHPLLVTAPSFLAGSLAGWLAGSQTRLGDGVCCRGGERGREGNPVGAGSLHFSNCVILEGLQVSRTHRRLSSHGIFPPAPPFWIHPSQMGGRQRLLLPGHPLGPSDPSSAHLRVQNRLRPPPSANLALACAPTAQQFWCPHLPRRGHPELETRPVIGPLFCGFGKLGTFHDTLQSPHACPILSVDPWTRARRGSVADYTQPSQGWFR